MIKKFVSNPWVILLSYIIGIVGLVVSIYFRSICGLYLSAKYKTVGNKNSIIEIKTDETNESSYICTIQFG